ncbi:hypothetical protein AB0A81_27195 [Streptomyces flaveolus]|uniref:Uncharacterized protein n=1 Tax=Streptomyces flaveolus TaxID=67297 RepID=A0ABV1VR94_9ACTN
MADDPDLITRLRATMPPLQELSRRSADARAGADALPPPCARPGLRVPDAPCPQLNRPDLHWRPRRGPPGFSSMADAIDATRYLSSRVAAFRIGVGASTVKRWRQRAAPDERR